MTPGGKFEWCSSQDQVISYMTTFSMLATTEFYCVDFFELEKFEFVLNQVSIHTHSKTIITPNHKIQKM